MHKTEEIISEAVQGEQEVSIEKKANSLSFRQQIQEKIMEEKSEEGKEGEVSV